MNFAGFFIEIKNEVYHRNDTCHIVLKDDKKKELCLNDTSLGSQKREGLFVKTAKTFGIILCFSVFLTACQGNGGQDLNLTSDLSSYNSASYSDHISDASDFSDRSIDDDDLSSPFSGSVSSLASSSLSGSSQHPSSQKDGLSSSHSQSNSSSESIGESIFMKETIIQTLKIGSSDITGYWGFDETDGEVFKDHSGNNNHSGYGKSAPGINNRGGAASLASDTRLEIYESKPLFEKSEFTINFFMTLDGIPPNQFSILSKDTSGSAFRLIVSGMAQFVIRTDQVSWYGENSINKFGETIDYMALLHDWIMITVTYDGRNLSFYCDGKLSQRYPITGTMPNITGPLTIGNNRNSILGFDGRMDELLILNKAVGALAVQNLYNEYLSSFQYKPYEETRKIGSQSLGGTDVTASYPDFKVPPAPFKMGQYLMSWSTINPMTLTNMGIGTAVLGLTHNANYMKNAADWLVLKNNAQACLDAGLNVWLFDEYGFPSGGAGGNTITDDTLEHQVRGLEALSQNVKKGETVEISLPTGKEKFIRAVVYPVLGGKPDYTKGTVIASTDQSIQYTATADCYVFGFMQSVLLEYTSAWLNTRNKWSNGGKYPNLLSKAAGDLFVNNTYRQFTDYLGTDLMKQIEAIYTNEPGLMTGYADSRREREGKESYLLWTSELPAAFTLRHGYDLIPQLGMLFDRQDMSHEAKFLRTAFYQTVADLYDEAFSKNLQEYCESVGTNLTGHFLMEEYISSGVLTYGNFMQTMGSLGIPGNDLYIRRTGTEKSVDYVTLKYTSSAAHNVGKYHVQTLLDPILGGYHERRGNTFFEIPTTVWYENISLAYLLGSNQMTTYNNLKYPSSEYRKINDYAGRMGVLLRNAVDQSKVAVYYPVEEFQSKYIASSMQIIADTEFYKAGQAEQNAIAAQLINSGIDFNFIDAPTIHRGVVQNGKLKVGEYAYEVMVMPSMDIIPLDAMIKISQFEKAGGKVIWCGQIPSIGLNKAETALLASHTTKNEKLTTIAELDRVIKTRIREEATITASTPEFILKASYMRDIDGNGKRDGLLVIQNLSSKGEEVRIQVRDYSGNLRIFFPVEGVVKQVSNNTLCTIAPHSAIIIAYER
jgi:hypothetical protein